VEGKFMKENIQYPTRNFQYPMGINNGGREDDDGAEKRF
jgi:hypothetical protein